MSMNSEDVAHYLLNTPEFFEEHIETLAQITLAHPHGGRTISLGERQLLALREKNRVLEKQMYEMLEFARENEALQNKVHEFTVSLFAARDLTTLQEMIPHLLREIFSVPHVAMHLWQVTPPSMEVLMSVCIRPRTTRPAGSVKVPPCCILSPICHCMPAAYRSAC
jgi:uncharacterized protein YigA (DUF484 family)